jgi:hypothetical protein
MDSEFVIMKGGLYYKIGNKGYTGLKEDAERYTLDEVAELFPNVDSADQDGVEYMHEDDAPEYAPNCYWDVQISHEFGRTKEQKSAAEHRVFELETAMREILKPHYGLQGILEDGDDDAEAREYYRNRLETVRSIARRVMERE